MNLLDIILLSIGLAMDCFAVSTATGIGCGKIQISYAWKMPVFFGLFQGMMPLIGFLISVSFAEFINSYCHWIALAILGFIGGKMIVEEFSEHEDESKSEYFSWKTVILLAIATSIDALATGVIFVSTPEKIIPAISIIALGSFIFSCLGLFIGTYFGKKFTFKVGILGGIILIGIGIKMVIEHYL